MSFDERLRRQLSEQADQIAIDALDPAGPAARAARRQTRRRAAVAAAFVAVVGLSAAWVATQTGDEPGVATEPVADAETDDPVTDGEDDAASEGDPESAPTAVEPLTFTSIDADGAPGGFNLYTRGASGDLYYVLSTAPGLDPETAGFWRNDTLYTWTGDGWSNSTFTDRFVSTISTGDGLLYTLSTGSESGDGPAVGTSADGGTSWDWAPLDLPADLGPLGTFSMADAVGPAGHLVIASSAPVADYEEAFALAGDAGFEIGWETHQVLSVDTTAIRYVPMPTEATCADRFWTRLNELAPWPEGAYEEIWEDGNEPTEEELARLAELEAAFQEAQYAAQLELIAEFAGDSECGAYAECQADQVAWEREQNDRVLEVYLDLGVLDPGQSIYEVDWDGIDEDTRRAIDEALDGLWESPPTEVDPGCQEILYGPEFDEEDIETVTWESLGVTPPDSWNGAISAFLVDDGTTREIPVPFDPGWVQNVDSTADGFVVDVVEPRYDAAEPWGQTTVRWTGDERGWTSTEIAGPTWSEATSPDGTTYSFAWSENGNNGIVRTSGDASITLSIAHVFGSDDAGDGASFIHAGEYGVAAVSIDYRGNRSTVAYSSDGISWATTDFEGYWVDNLIVGDDAVMVFAHPFGTTGNTEVFLGRN